MKRGIVNKIINKKSIIATMIVLIIVILSGIGVTTNYNKGIKTNFDKADINTNYDPSGMGITAEQIIKKAVELTNNTNTAYSGGCIDFVNATIKGVQSNSSLHANTLNWENNSTINGISAQKAKYASTSNSAGGSPWFTVLGMDKDSLQPGDIIIGDGHAMIYLGQANSYEELNNSLQEKYGCQFTGLVNGFSNVDAGSYYMDYKNNVGCTYWTVDSNWRQDIPNYARVENYDWSSTDSNAGSKNLNNMKVYRFNMPSGNYKLNIAKRSTENDSPLSDKSNGIGGVKLTIKQTLNYQDGKDVTDTKDVTTKANEANNSVFGETKITDLTKPDRYEISEVSGNSGYNKIDLTGISIDVYKKKSENDNLKYIIDNVIINKDGTEKGRVTNEEGTENNEGTFDIDDDGLYDIGLEVSNDGSALCITVRNKPVSKFKLDIVKYEKGTTTKLKGAGFDIVINDGTKDVYKSTKEEVTNDQGAIEVNDIPIEKENLKYQITIKETTAPKGYIGLSQPITFTAESKLKDDKKGYELVATKPPVANAKKVEVKANEILVETENTKTIIDIHKGVKTVKNEDSGYYDNVEHDWVINTTVPNGINEFTKYYVTDKIDERLVFSTNSVSVKVIDGDKLTNGKEYKANYNPNTRVLTVSFINDDFEGGKNLPENSTIEIRFKTTFAKDENGNIKALGQAVPNQAELIFSNDSEVHRKYSENPEVHTGAVSVFKYEDTNGNGKHDEGEKALVGAEFKIALTEEDAKAGNFVKIGGKELTAVSNEDGIATFTGLSFGGDAKDDEANLKNGLYRYDWETASRDYYIVETVTPAGYEKLTDTVKVTVSKNSSEIVDLTEKINEMESVGNRPLIFDLALRKWVTQAIVIEDGKTVVTETGHKAEDNPEAVVKVDLKKKKLNDVVVKFKYSIRITNEQEVDGEAQEISDYIPKGLKFVKEDNPDWEEVDGKVVTDKLKGVTLKHNESAEVEIILTWINSEDNMGIMTNIAEISKDYNEYGYHDIDSTPNNKKDGEDDIDDAKVMITIKTGSEVITYIGITVGIIAIISLGICLIKKSFREI